MRLFYGGKKVTGKKGRYRGADLDVPLGKFHPEIETAVTEVFNLINETRPFKAAVQISDIKKFQAAKTLQANLTIVKQISRPRTVRHC